MPDVLDRPAVDTKNRFNVLTYLKSAEVDAKGDWWLVGIASGPRLDLQNERMSDKAVAMMREQILSGQIPLRKSHWGDWDEEMGFLRAGTIDPSGELEIRVWLDKEMPYCQTLKRRLDGDPAKGIQPRKLGMSIGGRVTEGGWFVEPGPDGSVVRVLDAIELDHVAVTSCPAYPGAMIDGLEVKSKQFARRWVSDIAKAVNWRRAANPEGTPAPPDSESEDNAGGEHVPLLKQETPPPPPPPQGEPPAEEKQEEEAYKGGRWCSVKEVTETDNVWIKAAGEQQEPPPPPPPAEGAKDMATDEKALKALDEKLDAMLSKVEEAAKTAEKLAEKNAGLQAELDMLKGERKGIHGDGGGSGDAPPATGGYVERLQESEAYKNAGSSARIGMLNDAMKKAGTTR